MAEIAQPPLLTQCKKAHKKPTTLKDHLYEHGTSKLKWGPDNFCVLILRKLNLQVEAIIRESEEAKSKCEYSNAHLEP